MPQRFGKRSCLQFHQEPPVAEIRVAAMEEAYANPGRFVALEDGYVVVSKSGWLYWMWVSSTIENYGQFCCMDLPMEMVGRTKFLPDTTTTQELVQLINTHALALDEEFGE